jgi:hypothetical protein
MGRRKTQPPPANLTWKDAIIEVLRNADEAMSYAAITDEISERRLHSDLGATPRNTVNAVISQSINKDRSSPFERVQRGVYRLRNAAPKSTINGTADPIDDSENEKKSGIINAIGMFWDRNKVSWSQNPRLLGSEAPNSSPVDFCNERGVYLLHDAQGVVYVGQTRDQTLGKRLWQHTLDRHGGRWTRFSWFGIYGVNADGTLHTNGHISAHITQDMVILSLEAVLIEAMEPRQNRQRGYDLQDHEYIQVEDPDISEIREQALLKKMTQLLHRNKV